MAENQDVYVVTGGAGGMGFASAQRLGKLGKVLLTDVVPGPLEKAAAKLSSEGIRVNTQVTDISDTESVNAMAGTDLRVDGGVTPVLVNILHG